MIKIIDSNRIAVEGLPQNFRSAIKDRLSIPDPAYHKIPKAKKRFMKQGVFKYYKENKKDDILYVPRGFGGKLMQFLDKYDASYETSCKRVDTKRKEQLLTNITLRDYQEPLLRAMLANNTGIVHLSTGGGKSVLAMEYIAQTIFTATIIVPDKTILSQFTAEIKEKLKYTPGQVGDGKKVIREITVATMQTLQADPALLKSLAERTGTLIIDECDKFITDKAMAVLASFSPVNFIGLTATPERSKDDGRTEAIQFVFGSIIAQHEVATMKPEVHVYATGVDIPVDNYADMVADQIENETRNKLIASIAAGEALEGKKVLILTKRVAHAQILYEKLQSIPDAYLIERDTKEKSQLLKDMKENTTPFTIIIGTMQLLGRGFDVPQLDRLIIAGDLKSGVLTTQACGRILRILSGKDPIIYDMCDDKNPIFKNQYKQRKKLYLKKEWPITVHPEYLTRWL